ncbi:unnamed protein product [Mesocestoides corti]|nr:unnamed protein product [Mesocestoides corti]
MELKLRKKALLSFTKRQVKLQTSNSAPSLTAATGDSLSSPPHSRPRFIITLHASSSASGDSSEGEDLPSVTLAARRSKASPLTVSSLNGSSPLRPQVQPDTAPVRRNENTVTSVSNFPKKPPLPKSSILPKSFAPMSTCTSEKNAARVTPSFSLSPYKKLLLKQSVRVEHLQVVLKKQQKVVADRKKTEAALSLSLASLKAKLRQTTKLHLSAKQAVSKANKAKQVAMRELHKAQQELKTMTTVVDRLARKSTVNQVSSHRARLSQHPAPENKLPPALLALTCYFSRVLDGLETAFRITSPLFQYFNLFDLSATMPEEVEMTPASPEVHTTSTSFPSQQNFDPNTPICPFYLDGNCVDKTCTFQHPGTLNGNNGSVGATLPTCMTSATFTKDSESLCNVCGAQLDSSQSTTPEVCRSVFDWHTVFATRHDLTPFLKSHEDLSNEHDGALLRHHLHAVLVSTSTPVAAALEFLEKTNFSPNLLSYALNSRQLGSLAARRQLIRQSLSVLLSQTRTQMSSFSDSVSCMNSFVSVAYHACRLEWEACASPIGVSLLDSLLRFDCDNIPRCLPRGHPARWALWYLRVIMEISPTFPQSFEYCPFLDPERLALRSDLFRTAALDLNLCNDGLSDFLSKCHRWNVPLSQISVVLSFSHLYVQFLAAEGNIERGALFCLDALVCCNELLAQDNIFFPTAVHLSNLCLQRGEASTFDLVSDLTNQHSIQTTFAYYFACLMQKSGKPEPCSSLLSELVGGLVLLPSLDAASVYSAFRTLLGLGDQEESQHSCDAKNTVYLWMGFGLFSMLHNFSSSLLPDFINHAISSLKDFVSEAFPCPLGALLLHLGLALANMLPTAEEYSMALEAILFPKAFTDDSNFCTSPPPWFFELLQYIQVDKFSDSYPPNPLFARLLETYGFRTLKALLASGLLRSPNPNVLRWLQSLCSVARLEQPADEEFWVMIASLGFKFHPPQLDNGRTLRIYLADCFSDAVKLLPLSCALWRHYALVVRDGGFDEVHRASLRKRAVTSAFGMETVVDEIFESTNKGFFPDVAAEALACKDLASWWNQA